MIFFVLVSPFVLMLMMLAMHAIEARLTSTGELSDLVSRVAFSGERISLPRHGKAVAALVSAEDLARLEALDAGEERPDDRIELGRPRIDPIQPVPALARRFDIAAEHRQPPHPDRGGRP